MSSSSDAWERRRLLGGAFSSKKDVMPNDDYEDPKSVRSAAEAEEHKKEKERQRCVNRWREKKVLVWPFPYQLTDSDIFLPYKKLPGRFLFFGLRAMFAIWCIVIFIYGVASGIADAHFWFLKMAGWTWLFTTAYFVSAALFSGIDGGSPPKENGWARKMTFLLFEFAFAWSPACIVLFWGFYMGSPIVPDQEGYMVFSVHTHALGFAWLILELVWNKIEFIHSHILLIFPSGILFVIINAIWIARSDPLRWQKYGITWQMGAVWTGLLVGILIGFYAGYLITYLTRDSRRKNNRKKTIQEIEEENKRYKSVFRESRSSSTVQSEAATTDADSISHTRDDSVSEYPQSVRSASESVESSGGTNYGRPAGKSIDSSMAFSGYQQKEIDNDEEPSVVSNYRGVVIKRAENIQAQASAAAKQDIIDSAVSFGGGTAFSKDPLVSIGRYHDPSKPYAEIVHSPLSTSSAPSGSSFQQPATRFASPSMAASSPYAAVTSSSSPSNPPAGPLAPPPLLSQIRNPSPLPAVVESPPPSPPPPPPPAPTAAHHPATSGPLQVFIPVSTAQAPLPDNSPFRTSGAQTTAPRSSISIGVSQPAPSGTLNLTPPPAPSPHPADEKPRSTSVLAVPTTAARPTQPIIFPAPAPAPQPTQPRLSVGMTLAPPPMLSAIAANRSGHAGPTPVPVPVALGANSPSAPSWLSPGLQNAINAARQSIAAGRQSVSGASAPGPMVPVPVPRPSVSSLGPQPVPIQPPRSSVSISSYSPSPQPQTMQPRSSVSLSSTQASSDDAQPQVRPVSSVSLVSGPEHPPAAILAGRFTPTTAPAPNASPPQSSTSLGAPNQPANFPPRMSFSSVPLPPPPTAAQMAKPTQSAAVSGPARAISPPPPAKKAQK